jgi:hypothetical protein
MLRELFTASKNGMKYTWNGLDTQVEAKDLMIVVYVKGERTVIAVNCVRGGLKMNKIAT